MFGYLWLVYTLDVETERVRLLLITRFLIQATERYNISNTWNRAEWLCLGEVVGIRYRVPRVVSLELSFNSQEKRLGSVWELRVEAGSGVGADTGEQESMN